MTTLGRPPLSEELDERQTALLLKAVDAHESQPDRLQREREVTQRCVREALEAGVPAKLLARSIRVTITRIYQLRDQARA